MSIISSTTPTRTPSSITPDEASRLVHTVEAYNLGITEGARRALEAACPTGTTNAANADVIGDIYDVYANARNAIGQPPTPTPRSASNVLQFRPRVTRSAFGSAS